MAAATTPQPTPENIFNTINAYQTTAALKTGIELDVFTAIAEGVNDSASLAKKLSASEHGVRILCDTLTMMGFLSKQGSAYALTPESAAFLNRRSPAYLGTISNFLLNDRIIQNFANLTQVVKHGGSVVGNGDNEKPNDDFWVPFAKNMAPLTFPSRTFIARFTEMPAGRPAKILDIAAGHGMYGIQMAMENPNAQVTALDWPPVLEVAKENAKAAGVSSRFTTRPGSAFTTDFGQDYDYILFTNFFHHFDPPTCEQLMRKAHAALKPGGKSITLDFIPNEDRISPHTSAMFSIIMLATTDNGDAYTFAEYQQMFRNAGFKTTTLHPVEGMPQQVLASVK